MLPSSTLVRSTGFMVSFVEFSGSLSSQSVEEELREYSEVSDMEGAFDSLEPRRDLCGSSCRCAPSLSLS